MNAELITMLCVLIIPIVMVVVGVITKAKPPKEINHIYGYRTKLSMSSQAAWDYANTEIGKLFFKWGIGMMVVSVIVVIVYMMTLGSAGVLTASISMCVIMIIQIIVMMAPVLIIEKNLKSGNY